MLGEDVWSSELVLWLMNVSPVSRTQTTLSHFLSSFGWDTSVRCCACRLQLCDRYTDEEISIFFFFYIKKEASHKQAPLLMKDSRSDWLAVMQIKLQRCSTEWADRHAALQCLHEERNQRSLKLRKQDQRNKWRSISPEEVYRLTGMYRMCRGFNCWYIMRLSVLLSKADGDSNVVMNPL